MYVLVCVLPFLQWVEIVALVLQSRTAVQGIRFEFFQLSFLTSNDVVVTLISLPLLYPLKFHLYACIGSIRL